MTEQLRGLVGLLCGCGESVAGLHKTLAWVYGEPKSGITNMFISSPGHAPCTLEPVPAQQSTCTCAEPAQTCPLLYPSGQLRHLSTVDHTYILLHIPKCQHQQHSIGATLRTCTGGWAEGSGPGAGARPCAEGSVPGEASHGLHTISSLPPLHSFAVAGMVAQLCLLNTTQKVITRLVIGLLECRCHYKSGMLQTASLLD